WRANSTPGQARRRQQGDAGVVIDAYHTRNCTTRESSTSRPGSKRGCSASSPRMLSSTPSRRARPWKSSKFPPKSRFSMYNEEPITCRYVKEKPCPCPETWKVTRGK
ncbi:unnamed protein product, partial [Discosporangium mesarthrocarpum]